jgi:uncharacterized SAM-binding protein YcdF (DUF218 family)
VISRLWGIFKSAAAIFLLLLIVLHTTPVVPAIANWLTGDWQDAKGDVLIVLGGDQQNDGTLGLESYWRCVYAVRAYRDGGFRRIVISGGPNGYSGAMSVARVMADFIAGLGVPREALTLEERSQSTHENALMTVPVVRGWPGTKVLMTSDIHMRRAHASFARAGLDTVPAPIPDIRKRWNSWVDRGPCIWDVGASLLKYGYYTVRGWV